MTFSLDRRSILSALATLPMLTSCAMTNRDSRPRRPGIAITIDDFDLSDTLLMSGEARDQMIRHSLRHHGIKAAGFVAGKYVTGYRSQRVLKAWSSDGHLIGNHSYSHLYYDGLDPSAFMADILRCEPLLTPYSGFRKLFRFPFLAEGKTEETRDAMRRLLREHGYRNGHVTIDTSDWFIDNRLRTRLKTEPKTDVVPYRQFYLDHMWERATYYDGLSQRLFGHSIEHTILLHHRLTTALFLPALLSMFQARGWRLIDATTAFAAPELRLEPDSLPAGQSLIWAAAKASGKFEMELRYPGEDDVYEVPKMDALGL